MSSSTLEPRWPPRSPHEALLSSPSGRNKIRQQIDRTSPSPSPLRRSPLKKSKTTPNLSRQRSQAVATSHVSDDEEDEETLQLQLQALEAKLKLKRLQQKKNKLIESDPSVEDGYKEVRNPAKENRPPTIESSSHAQRAQMRQKRNSNSVQIAASPQKRFTAREENQSPKKVLLGIDKGLTGKNVSLKRAPIDRDPFHGGSSNRDDGGNGLVRTRSMSHIDRPEKPKSFSERIAESRQDDRLRQQNTANLRARQSTGFGVRQEDVNRFKDESITKKLNSKQESAGPMEYSREQILKAANRPDLGLVRRSNTTSRLQASQGTSDPPKAAWRNPNADPEIPHIEQPKQNTSKVHPQQSASESSFTPAKESSSSTSSDTTLFEPFSTVHLSRRILPHDLLTRTFARKSILLLPHLLQNVKSPDFSLPLDLEADYIVLGIIASKSTPLNHKDSVRAKFNPNTTTQSNMTSTSEAASSEQNNKGKFMTLTLTDLKWTLDLYLFDTAYTRFWKLDPGTVIAVLNPSIMPPPRGKADTGRFSLVLNSSDDTVLEIGTSRDLGWCSAVRKDGKPCPTWVDKRHTSVCEFHVDRVVERTRRGRMEVQGMSAPFAPGGRGNGRTGVFGSKKRSRHDTDNYDANDGFLKEGKQYDRGTRSTYFMAAPPAALHAHGPTVAQLLDAELGPLDRGTGSKEERLRKRLAEREKEDEIARKLGEGGNGAGSEYLRLRRENNATASASSTSGHDDPSSSLLTADSMDAESLGLRTNKAQAVQLSPLKKRKQQQLGLGGAAAASHGVESSARKKTRFVTEKGIREAGRESLGAKGQNGAERLGRIDDGNGDEDDELEFV